MRWSTTSPASPATATTASAGWTRTRPFVRGRHRRHRRRGRRPGRRHRRQARAAAEEADLVLFIVDGREGASTHRRRHPRLAAQGRASRRSWWSTRPTASTSQAALDEFARYGFKDVHRACRRRTGRASTSCWTQVLAQLPDEGDDRDPRQRSRPRPRRLRRPPQRRQVDAGQPPARRGADDRLRRAGHHPRFDRGRHGARRPQVPADRYRRPAPHAARSRRRSRNSRSSRRCRRSSNARSR